MAQSGNWGRIGGDVVLDLVDTVSWRLDQARLADRIPGITELTGWATERGLISEDARAGVSAAAAAGPDAAELAVSWTHQLRDAVTQILDAQLAQRPPPPDQVDLVRRRWQQALAGADVRAELPLSWTIDPRTPGDLARLLALRCGDFLREDHPSLRCCEGPGCGWLFLDSSRNRSRRWCDPQDCGNRVRVARHARKTSDPAATTRR